MKYISTKEAAIRWSISVRLVQRYCTDNSIPGAKKFGHYWMIPEDAKRPIKKERKKQTDTYDPLLSIDDTCIVCMPDWHTPGEGEQVLDTLSGETARLFKMELEYYRGNADSALILARKLLKDAQYFETRLACWQIIALSAVYRGNYMDWMEAMDSIAGLPSWRIEAEALKKLVISSVRLSFVDLSTIPEWLKLGEYDQLPGRGSFQAVFVHIKWLQHVGKTEAAMYAVKMVLTRKNFASNPLVRSYFELTLASLMYTLNDDESARVHIRNALDHILPDGLYGIIVENVGWLDSLLEEVMLEEGLEEQWKKVVRLYEPYKAGWLKVGRHIIGEQWVTDLTPREWEVLKFASTGLSTTEISERMHISIASVKKYLGTVYNKLSISGRNEIKVLLPLVGSGESDKK